MSGNYINIDQKEQYKPVYRIITIDRLIALFEQKKNALTKPELWDDPFENFILNIPFTRAKNGKTTRSSLRNRAYGQCWTLNVESDAMWRIYSPDKSGVKIKTTIGRLFQSLYSSLESYASLSCFIGTVEYYSSKEIENLISDRMATRKKFRGNIGQARSLLFKRNAFKHEREVRLIYLDPRNQAVSNVFYYPCNPITLIDRITFDPRMSSRLYKIYENHLRSVGYRGEVVHSNLYRPPEFD